MTKQNQIKRVLALPDSLVTVRQMVADGVAGDRAALANAVRECFGFFSPKGLAQTSGCLKASLTFGTAAASKVAIQVFYW